MDRSSLVKRNSTYFGGPGGIRARFMTNKVNRKPLSEITVAWAFQQKMCFILNLLLERTAGAEPLLSFNILMSTLLYIQFVVT